MPDHERQGTAYDPAAVGYERQGRSKDVAPPGCHLCVVTNPNMAPGTAALVYPDGRVQRFAIGTKQQEDPT